MDSVLLAYLHALTTSAVVIVWPGGDRRREFRLDYPEPVGLFEEPAPSGAPVSPIEIAATPAPSHRCLRVIKGVLGDTGRRMAPEEIEEGLLAMGEDWPLGVVRATLAYGADVGDLTLARDTRGRGYGLSRWA